MTEPLFDMGVAPGIYFNQSFEDYLAVPALSASGVKKLMGNPLLFWAESWLNIDRSEQEDREHQRIGKAYHCLILEGRDEFNRRFPVNFNPDDFPEALNTQEDYKERCRELDLAVSGTKPVLKQRILEADVECRFVEDAKAEFYRANENAEGFMEPDEIEELDFAASLIEIHEDVSKCFRGGFSEVSAFWYDPDAGIPFKVRFDYLKPMMIAELKTMAATERPMENAVYTEMAKRRYHIQGTLYLRAINELRKLGPLSTDGTKEQQEFTDKIFGDDHEMKFIFIFQQKGPAPLVLPRIFPQQSMFNCGETSIDAAMTRFDNYWRTFRTAPWVQHEPIEYFDDAMFPPWATEI